MDPRIEFILDQAEKLRAEHGHPEAIDLNVYTSEESLRAGGVEEMTLEEHTSLIHQAAKELESRGFTTVIHTIKPE